MQLTLGILYAGEMGAALGRVFRKDGLRVVTTLDGRSERTQRLCREAELEVLPSLADVLRIANVVVSVVPPAAALTMAQQYAALVDGGTGSRLYVDANAISPATAVEVGEVLAPCGVDYVDMAINGLASSLCKGSIVYLSGTRAEELANLIRRSLQVQVVGDVPGRASALKGALAGLSKGLAALFVEIAVVAREAGVSSYFLERCRSFYPGVMEVVERMLPTYPRHARRRADEMGELEDAIRALGLRPDMVHAARQVTTAMARANLDATLGATPWTAERVLEALHASGALRTND